VVVSAQSLRRRTLRRARGEQINTPGTIAILPAGLPPAAFPVRGGGLLDDLAHRRRSCRCELTTMTAASRRRTNSCC